jgi:hypothetical protein
MGKEIRERHLSASQEGSKFSQQSDHDQKAAYHFDACGDLYQWCKRPFESARPSKQFLSPMLQEEEAKNHPEQSECIRLESCDYIFHGNVSPFSGSILADILPP